MSNRTWIQLLFTVSFSLLAEQSLRAGPPVVNDVQADNHGAEGGESYLLAGHGVDGNGVSNRHFIEVSSSFTVDHAADFRIRYNLINEAGDVVETIGPFSYPGLTAGQTVVDDDPAHRFESFSGRLSPYERHRVQLRVDEGIVQPNSSVIFFPQVFQAEATGRTYLHFDSTTSGDAALNVIPIVRQTSWGVRRYLLDTMTDREYIVAACGYDLFRFDGFSTSPAPTDDIEVTLRCELRRESDNAVVPIRVSGVTQNFRDYTFPVPMAGWQQNFLIRDPVELNGAFANIRLDPAGQLDSKNENYHVRVEVRHVEVPGNAAVKGNAESSPDVQLFHFNGTLLFGAIETQFSHVAFSPSVISAGVPSLNVPVDQNSGFIVGQPSHTFGDGTALPVRLEPNGDAVFLNLGPAHVPVTGPVTDSDMVAGVTFRRSGVVLTASGLLGDLNVDLPAGCGWVTQLNETLLESTIDVSTAALGQDLRPADATETWVPGGAPIYVHEETKPVFWQCSGLTWHTGQGKFDLDGGVTPHSIRRPYLDALETIPGMAVAQTEKKSNDGYWRHVQSVGAVTIQASGAGAAQLSATNVVLMPNESFTTHFPNGTPISWVTGTVNIGNDLLVPTSSTLTGVPRNTVSYAQHCRDALEDECVGAAETYALYRVTPNANVMNFTPTGGLHAAGTTAFGDTVAWGRLSGASPSAHQSQSPFDVAHFFMAGHFVPSFVQAVAVGAGPALAHLTGVNPGNLSELHIPGDANYTAGTGDYAGVNLRASGADAELEFVSRLGGSVSDPYPLTANSKFYVRYSGVSGVQQAPGGLGSPTGTLFGFAAQLDSFGLGWLSNENVSSRTDGSVLVPAPSDVTFAFDDLTFSCLGAPGPAKIADGTEDKELLYWDAPFRALGLEFIPDDACDPSAGSLAVASKLNAQNVAVPLSGRLGFHHTGQILSPDSPLNESGVTSEFALPSVLRIRGPRQQDTSDPETYAFTPVRLAYLNDESLDNRPAGPDRVGFWNLVGGLDVPFFQDVKVHAHTSANPAEPTSALHMTGGFSSGPKSFFTDPDFDGLHAGRPTGPGALSVSAYRTSAAHRPQAVQTWLDVIEFEYGLVWNSARRSFRSEDDDPADLLLLEVDHRVDYLSPRRANLSFGVEFTGMPRISISNALFNELDENLGLAQNIVDAAGQEVFDAIEGGVDGFADLLTEQADRLVGEVVDDLLDPSLDTFFDAARDAAGDAIDAQDDVLLAVRGVVDAYLDAPVPAPPADDDGEPAAPPPGLVLPLSDVLTGFVGTLNTPSGLVPTLDLKLGAIQTGIFGLTGTVGVPGNPLPSPGLLGRGEFGQLPNLNGLIEGMVGTFAPDYSAALLNANLFNFITEAEPALTEIQATMDEINAAVGSLRQRLAEGQEFVEELLALQDQLDLLLEDVSPTGFLNSIKAEVQAYIDAALDRAEENLPNRAAVEAYLDSLRDEIEAKVKQEVRDRLMASAVIEQMRAAIRDRLQVIHMAFRETVDAAFEEINDIIRRALSAVVADLDETLNSYGAEINKAIKTGRVTGHAHIQDDALRELSLDALIEMGIPEDNPFRFDGFIRYQQMDSTGPGGCPDPGTPSPSRAVEVTLGARNVDLEWFGAGVRADVTGQVGILTDPLPIPISVGGEFIMREGGFEIAGAEVEDLRGTVKVGLAPGPGDSLVLGENYVGLGGSVRISGSGLEGGLFLGKSCDLEPILLINPQLGDLLGSGGFAGAYVFGAGRIPIVDFGCVFNLSAGVGAGAFYSLPGPTWGGIMQCSARGEALCLISVKGELSLIGLKQGDHFKFSGQGRVKGKAGVCPLCKRFSKTVRATYSRGSWDVDY